MLFFSPFRHLNEWWWWLGYLLILIDIVAHYLGKQSFRIVNVNGIFFPSKKKEVIFVIQLHSLFTVPFIHFFVVVVDYITNIIEIQTHISLFIQQVIVKDEQIMKMNWNIFHQLILHSAIWSLCFFPLIKIDRMRKWNLVFSSFNFDQVLNCLFVCIFLMMIIKCCWHSSMLSNN